MEYYSSLDASQLDSETPTLFEIISANQLEALLSPSLRYVLVHYAQKYPGALLKLANKFDEINLLLRSAVEFYFLNHWQGSFTENFYGLKRVSQTPLSVHKYAGSKVAQLVPSMIEERRRLTALQKVVSVFEITGTAYLLEKLGYNYELLYSKYVTNQLKESESFTKSQNRTIRLQRFFVQIYPYIQSSWRLLNLAATIMYLSGATKSPSLLTLIFKINYSRLNSYDYSRNEDLSSLDSKRKLANRNRPLGNAEIVMRILSRYITSPTGRAFKYALGTFFPLAIFSLKFLEWWNNSDFAQTLAKLQNNSLEKIVPPPSVLSRLKEFHGKSGKLYKSGNVCPLCKDEISNPAIIETGYVFCYTCIFNYLRDSHKLVKEKKQEVSDDEDEDEDEDEDQDEDEDKEIDSENENEKVNQNAFENNEITTDATINEDINLKALRAAESNEMLPEVESTPTKTYTSIEISRGGRCPITGKRILGCKWNELKGEFDVDGIRRLIF